MAGGRTAKTILREEKQTRQDIMNALFNEPVAAHTTKKEGVKTVGTNGACNPKKKGGGSCFINTLFGR